MSGGKLHTEFERGVTQYSDGLKAFLRQRLGNEQDAEDALQEILYNLFRTVGDDIDSIANLPAWLYRAARNLLSNFRRRSPMESIDDCGDILDLFCDIRYEQESHVLRRMFWQQLGSALEELPQEQRLVWELSELNGLPIKEISGLTGVPQATVLSRKHYAVKYLRRKLRGLYDEIMN